IATPTNRPVLGIATARPDERILEAAQKTTRTISRIILDELPPEDRVRLVLDRFAPGEDQTAARPLADDIVAKSGGNPFFLREMVDALLERGILAESPKSPGKLAWIKRDAPLQAPTSVEALVATRID